jgi:hypothetical protein
MQEIALREKRGAAIHEAGHAYICSIFGGCGMAKIWRNTAKNVANGEKAWLGSFAIHAEPRTMEISEETRHEGGFLPTPDNWKPLLGLAGLVAEYIDEGNTDAEVILEEIHQKIEFDEVSQTDLELMGNEFQVADVSTVINLLRAGWKEVELNTQSLAV